MSTAPIEKYVPAIKENRALRTNYPLYAPSVTVGGLSAVSNGTLASAATIAFTPANLVVVHTPTQNETINFSTPPASGARLFLEVLTSGVTSYTLTFGTNTKNQGTLATGTVTAKTFLVAFVSDGTNWVEQSRTTAM